MCVLIIDPQAEEARTTVALLKECALLGLESHTVPHVSAALSWLELHTAEVVLLELDLPDTSGLDALQRLVRGAPSVPVVVLTGAHGDGLGLRAIRAGAQDFLSKESLTPANLERALLFARERHAIKQELERLARSDGLTGLLNQRALRTSLHQALVHHRRQGEPLSLLFIDLDHFKTLNDVHGHEVGNATLVMVADALRQTIRKSDLAARYGGEEFCVVLLATDLSGATEAAERFRSRLRDLCTNPAIGVELTCSVGVAEADVEHDTVDSLIDRADALMYQAKRQGRDQICAAPP